MLMFKVESLAIGRVKGLLVLHAVRWQGLSDPQSDQLQSAEHLRQPESPTLPDGIDLWWCGLGICPQKRIASEQALTRGFGGPDT